VAGIGLSQYYRDCAINMKQIGRELSERERAIMRPKTKEVRAKSVPMRALRRAIIFAAIAGLAVVANHIFDLASAKQTLETILNEHVPGKTIKVESASFPFYYSIPLAVRFDILPSTYSGTFRISSPALSEDCARRYYDFETNWTGGAGTVQISSTELFRITSCMS
jgi:hypothetical protein